MKTYEELFDNQFNPHLEIIHFVPIIIENQPEIETEFAENMQKQDEKPIETKIESTALEPVFSVRDITPKKHFWRK